ncbi:hypothetical protein [Sphingobacterium mizutaii]|uniref:hypothetical protein n=1 Tax=Sphingobacterium mizutaii TaxID=1010 RepID=UPI00289C94F5|nr:hypothetical protein [Sphingobacterium mizutaii]
MKKILNIICFVAVIGAFAACSKDDEEVKTPKDTTELIGKWVKVNGLGNVDTAIIEGPQLDTLKMLEFMADNKLKVSRGKFCNFQNLKNDNQEGDFEYYSVNNSPYAGINDRIKYSKECSKGMPVTLQGNTLRIGFGNEAGTFEEYRKVVPAETPELPETPEVPTEPTPAG